MKRCHSNINSINGFTMIEIIATILIMGILAAFFIHFMGEALDNSWESVYLVSGEAEAEGIMEQILADYVREMNSNPDTALGTLKSKAENNDYDGQVLYDGDVIDVTMKYIGFDENGNEITVTSGTSEMLQVTAQAPGNDLTMILTKSRWKSTDPIIDY